MLAVLSLFWVVAVEAERPCLQDPAITGRTCPAEECVALQVVVDSDCKQPAPLKCTNKEIEGDCAAYVVMRQKWLDCYLARTIMNERCWGGGDFNHQEKAATALVKIKECNDKILEECPGACRQLNLFRNPGVRSGSR